MAPDYKSMNYQYDRDLSICAIIKFYGKETFFLLFSQSKNIFSFIFSFIIEE